MVNGLTLYIGVVACLVLVLGGPGYLNNNVINDNHAFLSNL